MERTSNRARWQLLIGLLVGVASLAAVFIFYANPAEILASLRTAHYGYLLLSALGITAFLVIRAVRWRFMLSNVIPFSPVFHTQSIGYMLTQLLPFRLGDVARAILIGNVPPVTVPWGLSTMVVERLLDMLFIVVLLPFTLSGVTLLPDWMRSFAMVSGFLALGGIVVLIIAANQRERALKLSGAILQRLPFLNTEAWLRRIDELLAGLNSLTNPRDGAILLLLSIAVWLPIIAAYYTTMLAVNLEPTWFMAGFVVCAAAFSVAVPSTPGQIGPFHFAVITALQLYGQPAAESASFAFLYHFLNTVVLIAFGVLGIAKMGVTFQHVVNSAQSLASRSKVEQPH
jgi:uncharacterized protein (TIRG00374 family)